VTEGQTFSKKVGEQILPEFLSIADDTTMKKLGKQDLLGYYQFDDEGVPAQRVPLVDHGVLKSFEMSRSPLVRISSFKRAWEAAARCNAGFAARQPDRAKQQDGNQCAAARQADRVDQSAGQAVWVVDR